MLGIIGGLLTGIPGILSSILSYLTTRNRVDLQKLQASVGADRDVMVASLQAQVAANSAKATIFQLPGVRVLLFMLYSPVILHSLVIVLGRIHFIDWDVLDFLPWEQDIVKSLVIFVPSVTVAGGFTSWLHK